jgi:hypothetical protein
MPIIPALERLRKENDKFEANLGSKKEKEKQRSKKHQS